MEQLTDQRVFAPSTQSTTTEEHLLRCSVTIGVPYIAKQNLRVSHLEILCFCRIFLEYLDMRVTNVYKGKV